MGVSFFLENRKKKNEENMGDKRPVYYIVRIPKKPVLVNAYTLVDGRLVNVRPDDTAADEDEAAGTIIKPVDVDLEYKKNAWLTCVAFPLEFVDGAYYAITNEPEPRALLTQKHEKEEGALVTMRDSRTERIMAREKARRAQWEKRSLYHLPGGLWVREGLADRLRRYMPLGGVDETTSVSFSDQRIIEESSAKKQAPYYVLEEGSDRRDTSYFIECEHGLFSVGWVVTVRKIDGETTALGYKTALGVRLLDQDAIKAVDTAPAAAAAAPAPVSFRNAGNPLFGSLNGPGGPGGPSGPGSAPSEQRGAVLYMSFGAYSMRWLYGGSFNSVGVPYLRPLGQQAPVGPDERVIIRLSSSHHPTLERFEREAQFAREIGRRGIGPEIYATLYVDECRGFAMERFQYALADVVMCPSLIRKAFVEADCESALVRLYMRSSSIIRCTDTKPGNVLVSFADDKAPRLALIDVDPRFCFEQSRECDVAVPDTFGVDDLDAALGKDADAALGKKNGDQFGQAHSAALSLLVHCIEGARRDNHRFGFPYPRVAVCLLTHLDTLWSLAVRSGAISTMTRYYNPNWNGRHNVDLTKELLVDELERIVSFGNIIEICSGRPDTPVWPKLEHKQAAQASQAAKAPDGALYERAAMIFLRYARETSASDAAGLLREVLEEEERLEGRPPLSCKLRGCKTHGTIEFGQRWTGRSDSWI